MRSPGRPDPSRAVQRQFWRLIATGLSTAEAAIEVGVSVPVGSRWFRHAGGMPPISRAEPSGRYLSFEEREEIALLKAQAKGVREIAREIGRDPGTVSRELRRNAATRGGKPVYRAVVAQWKAQQAAKRPKTAKLVTNTRLRGYVADRLAGEVRRPDGMIVPGPTPPPWKGLNKPHRADRRWATAWSPEQISQRLKVEFPDDQPMRISHEAIYQSLFIEGRGALKRELVTCLRTGRALRQPRARTRNKAQGHVTADVVLSERPAEAEDRAVPGHWEGDLIISTGRSAIGTLVERSSRATLLVHLPRMDAWGQEPYVKNGPALGGYGAVAMNAALTASMTKLPEQLRKTLTWDRGKELSGHALFALETGTKVFFADPHSPWQRPTNENTNGLLRQYSPRERTCPAGPPTTSRPSHTPSTTGPARPSDGRHPPRCSKSNYAHSTKPVLQRPIELAQYVSIRHTERLAHAGIAASVGSVGDSYDNALAESINGLYKTELIRPRGPWRTADAVEYATAEWVDWFNHRRLYEYCGDIPRSKPRTTTTLKQQPSHRPSCHETESPDSPGRFSRGPRRRRPCPQHQAPQSPQLEDTRRSPRRAPTLGPTNRCCFHWLNPVSSDLGNSCVL